MSTAISSMMSAQTTTAKMDATIAQVEALMQDKGISALPIVEGEHGSAIGIISTRDLIRFHHILVSQDQRIVGIVSSLDFVKMCAQMKD